MVQGKAILPYRRRTVLSLCPCPSCLISALFGSWRSRNILLANCDLVEARKPLARAATTEYVESQISLIKDSTAVKIAAVLNGNRYRIRNALVETMYKRLGLGHVLLAGDSAHAFSPAGGQGAHLSQ